MLFLKAQLQITVGKFSGTLIKLKDIVKLSNDNYQHRYAGIAAAIADLAHEVTH